MQSGIIKRVASDNHFFAIAEAVAKTGSVIIRPWDGPAELFHLAYVRNELLISHAIVVVSEETGFCIVRTDEVVRG